MSIKLEVKDYCQNCSKFEANVDKSGSRRLYDDTHNCVIEDNQTIITCKDAGRCEMMTEFLRKNMVIKGEKKNDDDRMGRKRSRNCMQERKS